MFAFLAAGTFKSIEEAQDKICPPHRTFTPEAREQETYAQLYPLYSKLYFALGERHNDGIGDVLPKLIAVAAEVAEQGAQ
jgi:L-ribulokinase